MKPPKVLYAGDSATGGPANYLLGILRFVKADLVHIPPSKPMPARLFKKKFDVILLSDYSAKSASRTVQKLIAAQMEKGAGLGMIGGWGSFSGPFGGWKGSLIEQLLPVHCLGRDDRLNFPGGASVCLKKNHAALKGLPFHAAPAVCGLNRILPKRGSVTLLSARKIISNGKTARLETREHPLLVVGNGKRTAALATDLAPHWCGGLVDWGSRTLRLPVTDQISIQVGDAYARFVSSLILWLAGRKK